jgi:hypothetical protein
MSNRRKLNLAKLARVMGGDLQRTYGDTVTHEQLADAHRAAVLRNFRTMADRPSVVPQRLLDELAAIADRHAVEENAAAVDRVLAARTADTVPRGTARK